MGLQDRRTPRWLFEALSKRFGPFELDAYAQPHNAMCRRFLTASRDGSKHPWLDITFANPPFEEMLGPTRQAVAQAEIGVRSIMIAPVGCSQEWYRRYAIRGTIYVPDCRISFDLPDGTPTDPRVSDEPGANRDTIVIAFGGEHQNQKWARGEFRVAALALKGGL